MAADNRAAIYIRVSSEMQLDGYSLEAQERLCREYCTKHQLKVTKVYREEAKSASHADTRPELQKMLADAKARQFGAIVFYHLWRLSRSMADFVLMNDLEKTGIRLLSTSEGNDTSTPGGKLQRNITLAIGQHYLDQLRVETTRGKRQKAMNGESNASSPPYGYMSVRDGVKNKFVPGPDADVVLAMFERYATGEHTDFDIAQWLNRQGKRTKGNWGPRAFSKDTVRAMLKNRFYMGEVGYRGLDSRDTESGRRARVSKLNWRYVQGNHEPIVPAALFEKCQDARAIHGDRYKGRRRNSPHTYLAPKLLFCEECGHRLTCIHSGGANRYMCRSQERGIPCSMATIREDHLWASVDGIIASFQLPESIRQAAIDGLKTDVDTTDYEKRKISLQAELARINKMYQSGNLSDGEYDQETARIKKEQAELIRPTNRVDMKLAIDALSSMTILWGHANVREKSQILGNLIEKLVVSGPKKRVVEFLPRVEYQDLFELAFPADPAKSYRSGSDGI